MFLNIPLPPSPSMSDDKVYTSLDAQLKAEGWVVGGWFNDNNLPESLSKLVIRSARGEYLETKIIPADIARKGEEWQVQDPMHIIYCKMEIKEDELPPLYPVMLYHIKENDQRILPL